MKLSVIVPIYNEAPQLATLFATLGRQAGVAFELVLVDGGSTDGSLERARELAAKAPFPCRLGHGLRGRGRQMNRGVALSTGQTLLFLHADSRFVDERALAGALAWFDAQLAAGGQQRFAGHFALSFSRETAGHDFGFYFLECKARLERPGCVHGDQGYLLRRDFFDRVGPFDESLGFLEDNRLAEKIRRQGSWLLLPAALVTSSRRFAAEGFRQRQTLNALIMGLEAAGRDDLLKLLPGVYRRQSTARKLCLEPFFTILARHLSAQPPGERLRFWCRTGAYLAANGWQLALYLDARRAFRRGLPVESVRTSWLSCYDRCLHRLIDHRPGYWIAAVLAWLWFRRQR